MNWWNSTSLAASRNALSIRLPGSYHPLIHSKTAISHLKSLLLDGEYHTMSLFVWCCKPYWSHQTSKVLVLNTWQTAFSLTQRSLHQLSWTRCPATAGAAIFLKTLALHSAHTYASTDIKFKHIAPLHDCFSTLCLTCLIVFCLFLCLFWHAICCIDTASMPFSLQLGVHVYLCMVLYSCEFGCDCSTFTIFKSFLTVFMLILCRIWLLTTNHVYLDVSLQ